MNTSESYSAFLSTVTNAHSKHRIGDLRLFSKEIADAPWAGEGLLHLVSTLTQVNNFTDALDQETYVILFTGHMLDSPSRKSPRFPASKEGVAHKAIRNAVLQEISRIKEIRSNANISFLGITGGACGGDILFHEICESLGIETHMYLLLPRDQFKGYSINFAGEQWSQRFDAIYDRLSPDTHPVLLESAELPLWLRHNEFYKSEMEYDNWMWIRNNLWMLNNALVYGGENVSLVALWNGEGGDRPGGTQDMINDARTHGANIVIIDTKKEFGLP